MYALLAHGEFHMQFQFITIGRGEIGKVGVLAVIPGLLGRVEFGGICRKPFHPDICGPTLQVLPNRVPLVNAPTVKDEHEPPAEMPPETPQETHNIFTTDVLSLSLPVETEPASPWCHANRTDDRKSVVPLPLPLNWRPAPGSPCPSDHRLEHEAAFVKKDNAAPLTSGVFLYAASAACAIVRSPLRPAPGLGAPASGSSSPSRPEFSIYGRGDTAHESIARSPRPHALASTAPSDTRQSEAPSGAPSPAFSSVRLKAWADALGSVESATLAIPRAGRPGAIAIPNCGKHLRRAPLPTGSCPLSATGWPVAVFSPVAWRFPGVSCPILYQN